MGGEEGYPAFETLYHGMYQGVVFSGWVDRHLKKEWSQRYLFPQGKEARARVFITPAENRKEILLEAFPVLYQKPHPLPESAGNPYLAYRAEEVEPFCEEPGLSLAVRIQGHLYLLRQRHGISPSHMGRIVGRVGDYGILLERTLQAFSLPLLRLYLKALLSLGREEDWLWAERTLLPPMEGRAALAPHRRLLEEALAGRKRGRQAPFQGRLKEAQGELLPLFYEGL